MFGLGKRTTLPSPDEALPGSDDYRYPVPDTNEVLGSPLLGPFPEGTQTLYVGMGCFWGVERIFWQLPGVVGTAAGYMGGLTPHPTYEESCTGLTGHAETVMVAYDPQRTSVEALLKAFWENHDPTQGMRQYNDVGTCYRSCLYWTTPEQEAEIRRTQAAFQQEITRVGGGEITTEVRSAEAAGPFYAAEGYHQQYLHKNPGGYCNHGPNGCTLPTAPASERPAQQDVEPPR